MSCIQRPSTLETSPRPPFHAPFPSSISSPSKWTRTTEPSSHPSPPSPTSIVPTTILPREPHPHIPAIHPRWRKLVPIRISPADPTGSTMRVEPASTSTGGGERSDRVKPSSGDMAWKAWDAATATATAAGGRSSELRRIHEHPALRIREARLRLTGEERRRAESIGRGGEGIKISRTEARGKAAGARQYLEVSTEVRSGAEGDGHELVGADERWYAGSRRAVVTASTPSVTGRVHLNTATIIVVGLLKGARGPEFEANQPASHRRQLVARMMTNSVWYPSLMRSGTNRRRISFL